MTRDGFEHAVRDAGAVLGVDELLMIGSQAIHASLDEPLPEEALRSIEVDVAVFGDEDGHQADLIDGSIGEASMFHQTFGYYAQGVVERTAVLPKGWKDRLVRFESPGTNGVVALCLELHDLWLSKAIANRPKDIEFCLALLVMGVVDPVELRARLGLVADLPDAVRRIVEARISFPGRPSSKD
jgi:hypothetical protein